MYNINKNCPQGRNILRYFYFKRKDEIMEKEKLRVERALDKALENLDHIIDYTAAPEFV